MTGEETDRVVHATSKDRLIEVVRYDRGGKWWREERADVDGEVIRRDPLRIPTAVDEALLLESGGGTIYRRHRGTLFSARVRKAKAARD